MLPLFAGIIQLIRRKNEDTDNPIFKLHYKFTATFLIGCSIYLTAKQLVGEPISCIGGKNSEVPNQGLNDFCWIQTTYTVVSQQEDNLQMKRGDDALSTGIAPSSSGDTFKHHKYYQWVCVVLFLQALGFYLPKYIWNAREGHLIRSLAAEVNSPISEDQLKTVLTKEQTKKEKKELKKKMKRELRKERLSDLLTVYFLQGRNESYFVNFIFCEILNFANVCFQIKFLDYFLAGEFSTYGLHVFKFMTTDDDRDDPMDIVFPKMTKCTFLYYGPSGDKNNIEALCVLPLNVVNEKIFICVWIWFFVLLTLTGLLLIYRISVICSKFMRCIYLRSKVSVAKRNIVRTLCNCLDAGDWFLLCQLSNNVHVSLFEDVIIVLWEEVCDNDQIVAKTVEMKESKKNSYDVA